jgi:hypothetical protein
MIQIEKIRNQKKLLSTITLPIYYYPYHRLTTKINAVTFLYSIETEMLLEYNAPIGNLAGLNHSTEVINYILNNVGTYYLFDLTPWPNSNNWVQIYFNNISRRLILEHAL